MSDGISDCNESGCPVTGVEWFNSWQGAESVQRESIFFHREWTEEELRAMIREEIGKARERGGPHPTRF